VATAILAGVVAVGVILLFAEVSPTAVNWILLLILVGMILSRWKEIGPLFALVERVAGTPPRAK